MQLMTKISKITVVLIFFSVLIGILGGFLYWTVADLPSVKLLEEYTPMESSMVYSSDGQLLTELYLERRTFIPYYQIPDHVKKAFISVEASDSTGTPESISSAYCALCGMTSRQEVLSKEGAL